MNNTITKLSISCDVLTESFYSTLNKSNQSIKYLKLFNMNRQHLGWTGEMLVQNKHLKKIDVRSYFAHKGWEEDFEFTDIFINNINNNYTLSKVLLIKSYNYLSKLVKEIQQFLSEKSYNFKMIYNSSIKTYVNLTFGFLMMSPVPDNAHLGLFLEIFLKILATVWLKDVESLYTNSYINDMIVPYSDDEDDDDYNNNQNITTTTTKIDDQPLSSSSTLTDNNTTNNNNNSNNTSSSSNKSNNNQNQKKREFKKIYTIRSISSFEKLNVLGEGTYGINKQTNYLITNHSIYTKLIKDRAKDKDNDRIVALKKLKMEKEKQGMPQTSLREIELLKEIDHVNVVKLLEVVTGSSENSVYLVFEYLENDLASLVDSIRTPFKESVVKCFIMQLLSAVECLHSKWIVHRDLKCSSISTVD
ncbi:protein serine/threonine kinase [Heterostelium album PN500]|uniref:Protein serine/threonine kinase n=1 Tax=Heterostelium pallidum (strain ATCC 26659 / Pp 5 / PN500) TaxID=670386 RepID=D3B396_HETP5|nr:protein serine/threonine kinase [Heterostelium album PN500]EFA83794.1 protein serine/threonine kinase [Heterostelium album PN500]|eukprot:XP_020435911.1 protein serine/threonine kinase [Heterostelium album PN500]